MPYRDRDVRMLIWLVVGLSMVVVEVVIVRLLLAR
jgi:uncharacterized membrane protein